MWKTVACCPWQGEIKQLTERRTDTEWRYTKTTQTDCSQDRLDKYSSATGPAGLSKPPQHVAPSVSHLSILLSELLRARGEHCSHTTRKSKTNHFLRRECASRETCGGRMEVTDRLTDRQTDRLTDWQTGSQSHKHISLPFDMSQAKSFRSGGAVQMMVMTASLCRSSWCPVKLFPS